MAIDLAGGKMYWVDHNAGRIQRANLDGSNVEIILSGFGNGTLVGIELDLAARKMYWSNYSTGTIQRANFDGSGIENVISAQNHVWDVTLHAATGKIYWSTWFGGVVSASNRPPAQGNSYVESQGAFAKQTSREVNPSWFTRMRSRNLRSRGEATRIISVPPAVRNRLEHFDPSAGARAAVLT